MLGKAVASLLLVAVLQGSARAEAQPLAVVEAEPKVSPSPVSPSRVAGCLLVAGGLLTVTVGGLLAYGGARQASDANVRLAAAKTPAEWDRSKGDFDAGAGRNENGWLLVGVGAAGMAAGALLLTLIPEPERRGSDLALGPWLTGDGGGLLLARRF